jgi:hypothetical protein
MEFKMKKFLMICLIFVSFYVYAELPQVWLNKYNVWMEKYDMLKAIDYGISGGNLNLFWEKARSDAQALFLGLPDGWNRYDSDYFPYKNMVNIRENELLVIWQIQRNEGREGLVKARVLYE